MGAAATPAGAYGLAPTPGLSGEDTADGVKPGAGGLWPVRNPGAATVAACLAAGWTFALPVARRTRCCATSASGYLLGSKSRYFSATANCPCAAKISAYSAYLAYKGPSFQFAVADLSGSWKFVTCLKTVTFSIKSCRERACTEKPESPSPDLSPSLSRSRSSCVQMLTTFSSLEPAR